MSGLLTLSEEPCKMAQLFPLRKTTPQPRPWYRRLWNRTWRLREALRGLRMGWRGELE